MKISTFIYLVVVAGALVAAGLLTLGVGEQASFVLGYVLVSLLAAVGLYRRHKRPPR